VLPDHYPRRHSGEQQASKLADPTSPPQPPLPNGTRDFYNPPVRPLKFKLLKELPGRLLPPRTKARCCENRRAFFKSRPTLSEPACYLPYESLLISYHLCPALCNFCRRLQLPPLPQRAAHQCFQTLCTVPSKSNTPNRHLQRVCAAQNSAVPESVIRIVGPRQRQCSPGRANSFRFHREAM
jgi:hypothetical protein